MKRILFLIFTAIISGHVLAKDVVYKYTLSEVEVVKDGTTVTAKDLSNLSYRDSILTIVWDIDNYNLNFGLENNTSSSIKIIWDDATFIDNTDKVDRVMHSGVKYIDREEHQPATTIPKGGELDDLVIPTDNVYWHDSGVSAVYSGWKKRPLFPIKIKSKEFDELKQSLPGAVIKVILPIDANGQRFEYYFSFKVVDVELQ